MFRLLLFLLAFTATGAVAQQVDTIRASPDAKKLRVIWTTKGVASGDQWGWVLGVIASTPPAGHAIAAVFDQGRSTWNFFRSEADTLPQRPFRVVDGLGRLFSGRFLPGRSRLVGVAIEVRDSSSSGGAPHAAYALFDPDDTLTAPLVLDPARHGLINLTYAEAAGDLDGDGADELVLYFPSIEGDTTSLYGELWIYRGGPAFQVDSPTVRIRLDERGWGQPFTRLTIGKLNNDSIADLSLFAGFYLDGLRTSWKYKIWFGGPGSPWNWSLHDKEQGTGQIDADFGDFDGDGILDFARPSNNAAGTTLLYLSTSGTLENKTLTDGGEDRAFYAPGFDRVRNGGYVNDASRRYEMLAIEGPAPGPSIAGFTAYFGGGPNGPDNVYEAYWSSLYDFGGYPISGAGVHGDITGDGYDEHLLGKPSYGNGIAFILAGGPDIPKDPSAGVRWTATEERERAIAVWPNPACDVVHIAWRGDLTRRPLTFSVYDASGALVATGEADPRQGEVEWRCEGRAAGAYVIVMLDQEGQALASASVVVQR